MTWAATFELPGLSGPVLDVLLEALTRINLAWLSEQRVSGSAPPSLYTAGVRYRRERWNKEKWLPIPAVMSAGVGDCEDLACWRAAELRAAGERAARPVWTRQQTRRGTLYHIRVRRADGQLEDPSRILGMT